MKLDLKPISLKEANKFVEDNHRHHKRIQGWKFGTGVINNENELIGIIIAGRPEARYFDDGYTLEVTRCCTDGTKNSISQLYGNIRRAAKALGYKKLITYTLESETGSSMLACGFKYSHTTEGGSWHSTKRPREDKHPLEPKKCWIMEL